MSRAHLRLHRLLPWAAPAAGVLGGLWQLLLLPGVPGGPVQWLIAVEAVLCAGILPALGVALLRGAPTALRGLRRHPIPGLPILGIAAAAFALRALLPPIFLHVEFVGLKYWSLAMTPELLYHQDPSFGRGGLLTQGILATLLGGNLRAFFVGNALLSAATVALGGFLVARWSPERVLAPIATACLLALHPILVRVGASEDVHVAGGFWALLSLLLLERSREVPRARALLGAVGAMILATCSRQFLLPMPLLFGLLWVERIPGPRIQGRPGARVAVGALVLTVLLKWSFLLPPILAAGSGIQHGSGAGVGAILGSAGALIGASLPEPHPLVDQWLTPLPVLLLLLWGLLRARRSGLPRTLVLAWAWLAVLSLPLGYWGISVRYLFRSLLVLVSLVIAGTGLGDLLVRLRAREPRAPAAVAVALVLLVAVLAIPRIAREAPMDPFTRQVFWWEATLPTLPEDAVILTADGEDLDTPNLYLKIPDRLLNPRGNEGRRTRPLSQWRSMDDLREDPAVYLFHGVACHGVSVFELNPAWRRPDLLIRNEDAVGLRSAALAPHPGADRIRALRGACGPPDLPPLRSEDPGLHIPLVALDNGNFFYEDTGFRIGLRRLR